MLTSWFEQPITLAILNTGLLVTIITFAAFAIASVLKYMGVKPKSFRVKDTEIGFESNKETSTAPELTEEKFTEEKAIEVECVDARISLANHRFFRFLRATQAVGFLKLTNIKQDTYKETINAAFLRDCKFKVFYHGILKHVKLIEAAEEVQRAELVQHFPSVVNDLIGEYNELASTIIIKLNPAEYIKGVPKSYLDKFNYWHTPHVNFCLNSINDVLSDRLYEDWYAQLRACLDFLYMTFEMTVLDAERTLAQLNGDLDRELQVMIMYGTSSRNE